MLLIELTDNNRQVPRTLNIQEPRHDLDSQFVQGFDNHISNSHHLLGKVPNSIVPGLHTHPPCSPTFSNTQVHYFQEESLPADV